MTDAVVGALTVDDAFSSTLNFFIGGALTRELAEPDRDFGSFSGK